MLHFLSFRHLFVVDGYAEANINGTDSVSDILFPVLRRTAIVSRDFLPFGNNEDNLVMITCYCDPTHHRVMDHSSNIPEPTIGKRLPP